MKFTPEVLTFLTANGFQVSDDNTKAWWEGESSKVSSMSITAAMPIYEGSDQRRFNTNKPVWSIRLKNSLGWRERFKAESDWIECTENGTSTYFDFYERQLHTALKDLVCAGTRL